MNAGAALLGALAIATASADGVVAAAPAVGGAVTAVAVDPGPARPAESGGRDSAATLGPLAIGAVVRDRTGVEIGHITRVTTDAGGRSIARVRQGEDVYSIPVADLRARVGGAVSTVTLDELRRGGGAIAADDAR